MALARLKGILHFLKIVEPEAMIWLAGLLYLAAIHPTAELHASFCPFRTLGIGWCPGCGLGRSVSFLLHGNVQQSIHAHPLGVFGVLVLTYRIADLQSWRWLRRRVSDAGASLHVLNNDRISSK